MNTENICNALPSAADKNFLQTGGKFLGNPTEENIAKVMAGFQIFLDHTIQTNNLDMNKYNFLSYDVYPVYSDVGS